MFGLSKTWTVLLATGAVAAVGAAVAVPVLSSAPAASTGLANVIGTTVYACVSSQHTFTLVGIGTAPRCPSGSTLVRRPGQAGAQPSPSPARTAAPSPKPAPSSPAPISPSPAPTTASWAFCSSATNGFQQFGPFALFADEWNSSLPQTICGNSGSDWQVTSTQPAGQTGIATYPDVQLNYDSSQPSVSGLDPSATSSFAENMNTNSGTSAEAGYDIWLDVPGQSSRAEVMIWYDTFNRGTVGGATQVAGPVTFCGQSWQLWQNGPELIWFLPQNEQTGTVCPVQMLQWLQSNGHLSAGASLSQFENGWEIASTGGVDETFSMTSYSVSGLPAGN